MGSDLLRDFLYDFPFETNADRDNFICAMLTPLIGPAIRGNRPMFFATATIARTGKSKLMQDVMGAVLLGRQVPSMAWSGTEEERDKRILSLLIKGSTLVCLDNIPSKMDSAALAQFITSETYGGRLLGTNKAVDIKNTLTVFGTGNNTRFSEELAKRCVPIRLKPKTDKPEARSGFKHPDIYAWTLENRRDLLETFMGYVDRHLASHTLDDVDVMAPPKGGFEGWSKAMNGIMYIGGLREFRTNEEEWMGRVDDELEERTRFVELWQGRHGKKEVTATELLTMLENTDLLGRYRDKTSPRGQVIAVRNYLKKIVGIPVNETAVSVRILDGVRRYHLV
jgi:hypothetical protein